MATDIMYKKLNTVNKEVKDFYQSLCTVLKKDILGLKLVTIDKVVKNGVVYAKMTMQGGKYEPYLFTIEELSAFLSCHVVCSNPDYEIANVNQFSTTFNIDIGKLIRRNMPNLASREIRIDGYSNGEMTICNSSKQEIKLTNIDMLLKVIESGFTIVNPSALKTEKVSIVTVADTSDFVREYYSGPISKQFNMHTVKRTEDFTEEYLRLLCEEPFSTFDLMKGNKIKLCKETKNGYRIIPTMRLGVEPIWLVRHHYTWENDGRMRIDAGWYPETQDEDVYSSISLLDAVKYVIKQEKNS